MDLPVSPDTRLQAVICDIDGCLSDCNHRLGILQRNPKNFEERDAMWHDFHSACYLDNLNAWCVFMLEGFLARGLEVTLLTGRPERYRTVTEHWLLTKCPTIHKAKLQMRPNGDYRQASRFKRESLLDLKRTHDVILAIDDDHLVIDMYRECGVTALEAKTR